MYKIEMFKKSKILIPLILLTFILMIYLLIGTGNSKVDKEALFLSSDGYICLDVEEEQTLSLVFIDSYEENKIDMFTKNNISSIDTDNPNISVSSVDFEQGDTYKDISFYAANIKIKAIKEGLHTISSINLNLDGTIREYDIGEIMVESYKDNGNDDLTLMSNTATGPQMGEYFFNIANISDHQIKIIEVDSGKFEKYNPEAQFIINDVVEKDTITLKKEESMDSKIKFNKVSNFEICYFSPKLIYEINGEQETYYLPFAYYGLPIATNDLEVIYQRYITSDTN